MFALPEPTSHRFWSLQRASWRSSTAFSACRVALGHSLFVPGRLLGRSRGAPETLQIVPRSFLGVLGCRRSAPGSFWHRFWVPPRPRRIDFGSISASSKHRYDIDLLGSTWHRADIDVVRSIGQAARVAGSIWWQPFDLAVDDSTNA